MEAKQLLSKMNRILVPEPKKGVGEGGERKDKCPSTLGKRNNFYTP